MLPKPIREGFLIILIADYSQKTAHLNYYTGYWGVKK
jgi:hypothetical protein